jgi:hypothetical protein
MALKIQNVLAKAHQRQEVEHAVRGVLSAHDGEFEAVITHGVDLTHAEVLILERGEWRAACFVDLTRPVDELSSGLERALASHR